MLDGTRQKHLSAIRMGQWGLKAPGRARLLANRSTRGNKPPIGYGPEVKSFHTSCDFGPRPVRPPKPKDQDDQESDQIPCPHPDQTPWHGGILGLTAPLPGDLSWVPRCVALPLAPCGWCFPPVPLSAISLASPCAVGPAWGPLMWANGHG